MAVTRIKNNQITDQTITYTKLLPGTLVGSVFNPDITLNSNITVVGNFTVTGATSTVSSTNTFVNDPLLVLNNGYTGSISGYDIGLLINRNLNSLASYGSVNTAFTWDEATGQFQLIATTNTGGAITSLNNSGWANLQIGNLTQISSSITSATPSTDTVTGALKVAGGVGIGGRLNVAGNIAGAASLSIGGTNFDANSATFALVNNTISTLNFAGSATTINMGNASGTTNMSGIVKVAGNLVAFSGTESTNNTTGALIVVGGAAITANANIGGNLFVKDTITSTGNLTITPKGNVAFQSGTESTSTTTGALVVTGGVGIGRQLSVGGNINTASSITVGGIAFDANSTTFSLVNSGVTTLNMAAAATTINLGNASGTTNMSGIVKVAGNLVAFSGQSSSGTTTGALVVAGGAGISGALYTGSTITASGNIVAQSGTASSSTTTGALIVAGGAGVTGNVNVGGTVITAGINNSGIFNTTNTTAATSISTGAIITAGGIGVAKDSWFGANVTILGNLSVTGQSVSIGSSTLSVLDPIINLHTPSDLTPLTSDDGFDIGLKMHYYSTTLGGGTGDNAAALVRAHDTGYLEWYEAGSDTANVFTGTLYGTIKSGGLLLSNSTVSTSTTSGALRVSGGAGIVGDTYIGGKFTSLGNIVAQSGTVTTSTTTGALVVNGGAGITGSAYVGGVLTTLGNVVAQNSTASTNTTTGALVVTGGVGIGGKVYTGDTITAAGNIVANATTTTVDVNTGSIVAKGGIGVAGVGIFGGNIVSTATTTTVDVNTGSIVAKGGLGVAGVGIFGGNLVASATTASTNTTTGALIVTGGVGIGGKVYTGDTLTTAGNIVANATTTTVDVNTGSIVAKGGIGVAGVGIFGGNVVLNSGTASTNTTTGALVVVGGMGISGVATHGGNIVAASGTNSTSTTTGAVVITAGGGLGVTGNVFMGNGVIINSAQTSGSEFFVRGKNDTSLIYAKASTVYDSVTIGGSATSSSIVNGAKLNINSNDAFVMPRGTTSQRPGAQGFTDIAGMMRFNTSQNIIEFYDGTNWNGVTSNFTVIQSQIFNGDGSTLTFTLTAIGSAQATTTGSMIYINGTAQQPTLAYSISNNVITFTEAPAIGDVIDVRVLVTTSVVSSISSSNGLMNVATVDGAIQFFTAKQGDISKPTTYIEPGGAFVSNVSNVSTSTSATTVDYFSTGTYRSAKYKAQSTYSGQYEVQEMLVIHDGTNAYISMYGDVYTGAASLGDFSATVSSGNVLVQYTAVNSGTQVRMAKEYFTI